VLLFPSGLHFSTRHVVFIGFDRAHCLKTVRQSTQQIALLQPLFCICFSNFGQLISLQFAYFNLPRYILAILFPFSGILTLATILVSQACKEVLSC
jgi:hypothetical protein